MMESVSFLQFGFNNGQTMVDGLYAGSTYQVMLPHTHQSPGVECCSTGREGQMAKRSTKRVLKGPYVHGSLGLKSMFVSL